MDLLIGATIQIRSYSPHRKKHKPDATNLIRRYKMNIKIEYDKEIDQVFISGENKSIQINRTEVATVEKILEALEIPYT